MSGSIEQHPLSLHGFGPTGSPSAQGAVRRGSWPWTGVPWALGLGPVPSAPRWLCGWGRVPGPLKDLVSSPQWG